MVTKAAPLRQKWYILICIAAMLVGLSSFAILFAYGGHLYLPPLKYAIGKVIYFPCYFIFLMAWYCYIQKKTSDTTSYCDAICFLFPAEICIILFFAQWHFWVVIWTCIGICIVTCVFTLYLPPKRSYVRSKATAHHSRVLFFHLSQMLCLVATVIFCAISIVSYQFHSPLYTRVIEGGDVYTGPSPETSQDLNDYRDTLRSFHPFIWPTLDIGQRLTSTQALADMIAERLEIEPLQVQTASLQPDARHGEYDGDHTISIDDETLATGSYDTIIEVVCHEVYHAYQQSCVARLEWLPFVPPYDLYVLYAWQNNYLHYINTQISPLGYINQPLETTAEDYALSMVSLIQDYCYSMPETTS